MGRRRRRRNSRPWHRRCPRPRATGRADAARHRLRRCQPHQDPRCVVLHRLPLGGRQARPRLSPRYLLARGRRPRARIGNRPPVADPHGGRPPAGPAQKPLRHGPAGHPRRRTEGSTTPTARRGRRIHRSGRPHPRLPRRTPLGPAPRPARHGTDLAAARHEHHPIRTPALRDRRTVCTDRTRRGHRHSPQRRRPRLLRAAPWRRVRHRRRLHRPRRPRRFPAIHAERHFRI